VAILNTCTVTATADAEVRQFVRRIHRRNPQCRILVTGCYAQRAPQEIAQMEGVAWVVGNSHKHLVSALLAKPPEPLANTSESYRAAPSLVHIQAAPIQSPDHPITRLPDSSDPAQVFVGKITEEFHFAPVFADDRTRPTLKVQDGCNARCAFCVIPSVRGQSRSLPAETVLEQVRQLADSGYQEIVLSGINLGGYGRDLDRHINFLGIVERILRETTIARIRISSIEPMDVSPALIRLVAQEPRMAQHFHVPLQSGCDRILRRMNRRYWVRQYAEHILAVREQIPNGAIGADVMVGFPGETAEDHATSLRFIESLPYTYLHVFPFSARPGTPAGTAAGQVNGRVARARSQEIRTVIAAKREVFLAAQVGQCLPALTLDEFENGARVALTTNYLKVALPGEEIPPNRLVDVWIGRVSAGKLFGYMREAEVAADSRAGICAILDHQ
jgi:threonylcarbamoyladenosine tRNA methylthiotransferase MtaB